MVKKAGGKTAKAGPKKAKRGPKKTACAKKTTKRYAERASPPFSGTAYCGETKKGNDGKMYVSRKAVDGSCRWHPMVTRSSKGVKKSCE